MRLRTVFIFGAGYLCGTRAGRDRYKEISESVRSVAESEVVKGYVDRAMDLAKRPLVAVVPGATETATEATGDVTEKVTGTVGKGRRASGGSSAGKSNAAGDG
jgi:hypothetical protein